MDVSQVKGSANTPLSWGVNYQDTETEKFAVFLKDQDKEPEPVRETRSREKDEPYEKADYADKEIDEPDDRDDIDASRSPKEDKNPDGGELLAAITALIPSAQNSTKVEASESNTSPAAQTAATAPALNGPALNGQTKAGSESVSPLANTPENSEKNAQGVLVASKETSKAATPAAHVGTNEASANGINGQAAATNKTATTKPPIASVGAEKAVVENSALPIQTTTSSNPKASKTTTSGTKTSEIGQSAASSNEAVVAQGNADGKATKVGEPSFLEKMRADENAKLTEKEVLSSKISEMLKSSNGKITSTASNGAYSAATTSSLISGQNAVAMSAAPDTSPAATATAISTVANATAQAEIPISMQPAMNSPAPVAQQAPLDPSVTGNSTPQSAAIPGVDSSSANSASQSASATRASMQAGSPAQQVSAQITTAVRSGLDQIKIQLNPAELGLVDIKLEIGQDGRVMATIAASSQESLDLLQQDSKTLEQALKDAGFETDSGSLNFSLNQQNDQNEGSQTANKGAGQSEMEQGEELMEPHQLQAYRSASDSNLDIQV
ncbi:MAG: flagellar hook-length control protein FliK [Sneathiella sp.]